MACPPEFNNFRRRRIVSTLPKRRERGKTVTRSKNCPKNQFLESEGEELSTGPKTLSNTKRLILAAIHLWELRRGRQ
jgi:hypothetical protein